MWGPWTQGQSHQAGGEGAELRGTGDASAESDGGLILPTPTLHLWGNNEALVSLGSRWPHIEEPYDLTCAWRPQGQTPSPCPPRLEEGGRGLGPALGKALLSAGSAWPLYPLVRVL